MIFIPCCWSTYISQCYCQLDEYIRISISPFVWLEPRSEFIQGRLHLRRPFHLPRQVLHISLSRSSSSVDYLVRLEMCPAGRPYRLISEFKTVLHCMQVAQCFAMRLFLCLGNVGDWLCTLWFLACVGMRPATAFDFYSYTMGVVTYWVRGC